MVLVLCCCCFRWGATLCFGMGLDRSTYVRGKHGRRDFAAVGAVADVGVDEAVAFDGLVWVKESQSRSLSLAYILLFAAR